MLALLLEGPKHGYALKKRAGLIYGREELHNNIVYPLLRRFVAEGWVKQRKTDGERGQTRLLYALTPAGRRTLEERIGAFGENEAKSPEAFRLRVGLFSILDKAKREQILAAREKYLESEESHYKSMEGKFEFEAFSGEVVRWIAEEIQRERQWVERLRRLNEREEKKGGSGRSDRRRR